MNEDSKKPKRAKAPVAAPADQNYGAASEGPTVPDMAYRVDFTPRAANALKGMDLGVRRRVAEKVDALSSDPRPPGCRKLKGRDDLWRVRVGDYRVVYSIHDGRLEVLVVDLGHRRDVYRRG